MKVLLSKKKLFGELRNILLVVFGTLLLAFGTAVFIIPFDLVTGGMAGISIVLARVLPFDLTVDVYVTILTWTLFLLGLFALGRGFALKTLVSSIFYPTALSLFLRLATPDVMGGFLYLKSSPHGELSLLVSAIFGGILVGAGCAVTFLGGGSTGGTDILAFVFCKIFKRAKSSVVIFIIDALIVLIGAFVVGDLIVTLLAISSAFVAALVIDYVFLGSSKAFVANVVTDKSEEINKEVIDKLERTTTMINVVGGYSGKGKQLIVVSFTIREYSELMSIISRIDRNAFVTISRAHEINGEGWTRE